MKNKSQTIGSILRDYIKSQNTPIIHMYDLTEKAKELKTQRAYAEYIKMRKAEDTPSQWYE